MHELAITERLLEITLRHAQAAGGSRVIGLNLVVGQLSSIIDDSVQFYWDIISRDTIAAGATLHFERVPAKLRCFSCHHEFGLDGRKIFTCPACQSAQVRVIAGDDFRLDSIDVEEE